MIFGSLSCFATLLSDREAVSKPSAGAFFVFYPHVDNILLRTELRVMRILI